MDKFYKVKKENNKRRMNKYIVSDTQLCERLDVNKNTSDSDYHNAVQSKLVVKHGKSSRYRVLPVQSKDELRYQSFKSLSGGSATIKVNTCSRCQFALWPVIVGCEEGLWSSWYDVSTKPISMDQTVYLTSLAFGDDGDSKELDMDLRRGEDTVVNPTEFETHEIAHALSTIQPRVEEMYENSDAVFDGDLLSSLDAIGYDVFRLELPLPKVVDTADVHILCHFKNRVFTDINEINVRSRSGLIIHSLPIMITDDPIEGSLMLIKGSIDHIDSSFQGGLILEIPNYSQRVKIVENSFVSFSKTLFQASQEAVLHFPGEYKLISCCGRHHWDIDLSTDVTLEVRIGLMKERESMKCGGVGCNI
jgi:hypothetical protein